MWHTSKPDCSNVVKTLEDRLAEEGFIANDAEVASLTVDKVWDTVGWFKVTIRELPSPTRKEKE